MQAVGCLNSALAMSRIIFFVERAVISDQLHDNLHNNIREIAFDRWGTVQMVQNLEGMGFTVVPFGQGFNSSYARKYRSLIPCPHPNVVFVL